MTTEHLFVENADGMSGDPTHLTGLQRTFDDLGTALHDVTFCVVDLETTGGSAHDCAITEIGAVKLRGGVALGTFQTLVNPGCAIPPRITMLTGISEAMVHTAPRIEEALAAFLEFLGGAVVVGHNVRFDLRFLQAALTDQQRPPLRNRSVDTCALARRLLGEEVPNHQLGTLADRLRLDHRPSHRALDDALATGDLLHLLIERATALGVTGLDDLLALPTMAGHAQAKKLRLTDDLPRGPGVYLFKDRNGDVLYVGKATNLRSRVRSYFSTDTRRKTGALLRETATLEHRSCHTALEAAVREIRLIHRHQPRYNRQGKRRTKPTYVKLTLTEAFPRLSIVRQVRDDGLYVGPFGSHRAAAAVVEAIQTAVPLRRCTARPGRQVRAAPCTAAQLGVATCPCSGDIGADEYQAIVERVVEGIEHDHRVLLDPLVQRMDALARHERYEEAADTRDRAAALSRALRRRQRAEQLRRAGRLVIEVPGKGGVELHDGCLTDAWAADEGSAAGRLQLVTRPEPVDPALAIDEALVVASWLHTNADRARLVHAERGLHQPSVPLPDFSPAPEPRAA